MSPPIVEPTTVTPTIMSPPIVQPTIITPTIVPTPNANNVGSQTQHLPHGGNPNSNPSHEDEYEEGQSGSGTIVHTCKLYLEGNFKFGNNGTDCRFKHPPMCHKFISKGPRGCSRGTTCRYVHPRLCNHSLATEECFTPSCRYFHITGIVWRPITNDRQLTPLLPRVYA